MRQFFLAEDLEFRQRVARRRLIALGIPHLLEVGHRQPVLGVVRPRVARVVGEELAILAVGEDERLGGFFAEVGVGDPQLGVGPQRALRIVVEHLTVVFARFQPVPLLERRFTAVEEEPIGIGDVLWNGGPAGTARHRRQKRADERARSKKMSNHSEIV